MYTPFTSRHFTTHVDAESGMKYAVLSTHLAPIQQGFYFVNSGWSDGAICGSIALIPRPPVIRSA